MNAEDTEKSFRKLLKESGKTLRALSPADLLFVVGDFWLSTTPEGLREENGDGLVAYFELTSRGKGIQYEFGVNRIMCFPPAPEQYSAWLPALKLRCSLGYKATAEIFQLKAPVSTFGCWDKTKSKDFFDSVTNSPQFQLIKSYTHFSSGVALSECDAPWGNPEHSTKGFEWAKT
ncbi:hypothetical protein H8K38_12475 [Undibacterium sp. FT79W]|uniref:hypothetical protein n=1 Tax=Undibacterium sp. FT79W TaxID=2762296 RepID=UPI00164AA211|nr:hypothetical protein [Undibacterium sp. FT79W]MBC3878626.1 hypothetical protein [Undibacterium sp. FT79W]